MKYLLLLINLLTWTNVYAAGKYNPQDNTTEMTYEDLENELALKKKEAEPERPMSLSGISRVDMVFGYAFAHLNYKLPSTSARSFASNGIDLRISGHIERSAWQIEGGFKNYSETHSGGNAAESRILTGTLRFQDILQNNLQYVLGGGTSLHFIEVQEASKRRSASDWSFNLMTGLRGPLTSKFNWGLDVGAYSPFSGHTLQSGIETSLMLSTSL